MKHGLRLIKPRLTHSEIEKLRFQLAEWQTPEDMWRLANDTGNRIGSTNLFNQSGLAFLRDALTAVEFGKIRKASTVRLVAEAAEWPDFEIEVGGAIEKFEAAEVDDPERRRGDEYRDWVVGLADPVADWVARAEQTPAWIAAVCQKKLEKRYGGRPSLIIYLNVSEHGIRQTEIESSFPPATAVAKDHFDAIWILWKSKAYHVWQAGTQASLPLRDMKLSAEVAEKRFRQRYQVVLARRRQHRSKRGLPIDPT
jgi:hypothetical protein